MKRIEADVAVIGGGPAGLAAALEAARLGVGDVLIIERDDELGGILRQCIHDGFGIHRFGRRMSGNQYAQAFIDEIAESGVTALVGTMVLEVTPERVVYACNREDGMLEIRAKAVILAMGCRERTAAQALILGERPAGVMTAGAVQRYINMEGLLPGKEAVILGSGDIGLIMARRMTLEGMTVKGVFEVMDSPGGLTRNIAQCLDDYGIPLTLSATVTKVRGKGRVEGVTVAKVGADRRPVAGTEIEIDCDLLVLAVGLIPENELSVKAGAEMDVRTKGPVLDDRFMTSLPGVFAAGNVAAVFDLVDYVSLSGEIAARGAVSFINGEAGGYCAAVVGGENVGAFIPQKLRRGSGKKTFFLRARRPIADGWLVCEAGGVEVYKKRHRYIAPPEMLSFEADLDGETDVTVSIRPIEKGVAI